MPRRGLAWSGRFFLVKPTRAGNLPGCRQDQANAGKGRSNQGCQAKVNIIYIMGHSPMRPTALKRRPGRIGTRTHGGLPHSLRNIGNHAVPPQTIGRRPADSGRQQRPEGFFFAHCSRRPCGPRRCARGSSIADWPAHRLRFPAKQWERTHSGIFPWDFAKFGLLPRYAGSFRRRAGLRAGYGCARHTTALRMPDTACPAVDFTLS
jgi:hypothetical protein